MIYCEGILHARLVVVPEADVELRFIEHGRAIGPAARLCSECIAFLGAAVLTTTLEEAVAPTITAPVEPRRPAPPTWVREEIERVWLLSRAALYLTSSTTRVRVIRAALARIRLEPVL